MAKIISVDQLLPEMILYQDIYNEHAVLMLAQGTLLTREAIQTIKELGYTEISIKAAGEAESVTCWDRTDFSEFIKFRKSYDLSGKETVKLIKLISDGHQVNVEEAYNISESIFKDISSPYNLLAYMNLAKQLDNHTFGHSLNVALICDLICNWLNLEKDTTKDIVVAGLLHDIGKTHIKPEILLKAGTLTAEEREEIKKHTIYGYRALEAANASPALSSGALFHHEREDGYGYPSRLDGARIPKAAKIISVADIYDAMTSNRPYRGKICPFKVIEQFQHNFYGALDTGILMTFLNRIADCYVGEVVRLNDGRTGQIVVIDPTHPARPQVWTGEKIINLKNETGVEIETLLPWFNHNGYK